MQLHTGYFGTLNNESAYSVDTVPTGMVVTDTVQFYLPDDGKMFTNGIVITDILIVGQDVIEDYGEVDDSGYVSILTKVNGKALFRDIMLTASDVSALSSSTTINDLTTTGQQDALNSGITSSDVSLIGTALQPNDNISELNNDTGYISGITSSDVIAALGYTPYSSSNPNGYQANVIEAINVNGTAQTITSKTVDITVPTDNSQISNGAGYITGITSGDVTTALGYTPYNSSNPSGYTSNVGTVTSVNNTQPDSNGDVTIPIPTVNDATLTINQGGTQKGTFSANASSDVTVNLDGNQRNIGEIVPSTIPLTDAGLHLLDGTILRYGSYKDFIDYIADLYDDDPTANYFTTEANWQTSVSTYGACGKFVYDSVNNTVRLPKLTGIVEGTADLTALGNLIEAGLPDHIHYVSRSGDISNEYVTSEGSNGSDTVVNYNGNMIRNTSNASVANSNSLYGKSNTVQPQTIKVLYYIVIANSTKTDIQVDIDEVVTDLNGKADVDLSNVANTSGFRKLVAIYNNGSSWYKVYREYNPTTGNYIGQWCEQGGTTGSISSGTKTSYLKTFTNTDYTFTMALLGSTQRDSAPAIAKDTDGFTIYHNAGLNNGLGWSYIACGYIS